MSAANLLVATDAMHLVRWNTSIQQACTCTHFALLLLLAFQMFNKIAKGGNKSIIFLGQNALWVVRFSAFCRICTLIESLHSHYILFFFFLSFCLRFSLLEDLRYDFAFRLLDCCSCMRYIFFHFWCLWENIGLRVKMILKVKKKK